jgi:hypothetical protein
LPRCWTIPTFLLRKTNTRQRHFKGITLHLLARIIVLLPTPVVIE